MEDTQLNRHIQDTIVVDEWATAIAMTRFTRRPEMGGFSVNDKRKYGNHITTFLGLIYEQHLLITMLRLRCTTTESLHEILFGRHSHLKPSMLPWN